MIYILIIIMSRYGDGRGTTSQQIEYKSKNSCENIAKEIIKRKNVADAFCVQRY